MDRFFADAAAYSDWWKKAEGDAAVLPLGVNTEAASGAVKAVKAKVDDYFARGRLAAFDPRSVNALNRDEKEYAALGAKDLTNTHADIASLPLAQVGATTPLPLTQGINPGVGRRHCRAANQRHRSVARRPDGVDRGGLECAARQTRRVRRVERRQDRRRRSKKSD